ncbi:MAG: hypothetical protein J5929_01215 [Eubacterium sp.]|nr:hypothetical protein [Eubacterium sp.]
MNDILVEIVCIATIKKYEFWIPKKGLIKDVIKKIADDIMIFENNDNIYDENSINKLVLVTEMTGDVLNSNYSVSESGVMGGDKLILI